MLLNMAKSFFFPTTKKKSVYNKTYPPKKLYILSVLIIIIHFFAPLLLLQMNCTANTETQPATICCTQHMNIERTLTLTSPQEVDDAAVLELHVAQNQLKTEREVEKKLAIQVAELKTLVASLQAKVLRARFSRKRSAEVLEEPLTVEPTVKKSLDYVFVGPINMCLRYRSTNKRRKEN